MTWKSNELMEVTKKLKRRNCIKISRNKQSRRNTDQVVEDMRKNIEREINKKKKRWTSEQNMNRYKIITEEK